MKKEFLDEQVFKVSRWIFQEIVGTIAEDNRRQLERWRGLCVENEQLYERLRNRIRMADRMKGMKEVDVARPLEEMQLRIAAAKWRRWVRRLSWSVSAAVVAVVLGSVLWLGIPEESGVKVAEQQTISAGGVKAILRLGDGRVVDLDTLTQPVVQGDVNVIKTEGRRLSYEQKRTKKGGETVYNEIEVPWGGEFDLILADGSVVWLNAGSKLRYPVEFKGKERKVYLEGEAYFKVEKDTQHPFIVEVDRMEVEVLGTQFNINTYRADGVYETTLVEGKVEVRSLLTKGKITILPDEQVRLCGGELSVRKVDAELYTSWVKGKFYFEREMLEEIAVQLERWYDVSFFFVRQDLKEKRFTGTVFRDDKIEQVLELIRKTADVQYSVSGKTITIY